MYNYVKFNDSDTLIWDVTVNRISDHIIEIIGVPCNTSGFKVYNTKTNKLTGDYSDYTTVNKIISDDAFYYSNDYSVYVEVVPEVIQLTDEEIAIRDAMLLKEQYEMEIWSLKILLQEDDYKIIKCTESQLINESSPYNIADLVAVRNQYRNRINELQELILEQQEIIEGGD